MYCERMELLGKVSCISRAKNVGEATMQTPHVKPSFPAIDSAGLGSSQVTCTMALRPSPNSFRARREPGNAPETRLCALLLLGCLVISVILGSIAASKRQVAERAPAHNGLQG